MNDKLLKSNEVAERLAISKAFAYRLMKTGEIPVVRIGKSVRVLPEKLDEFIREHSPISETADPMNPK
jgi:excisionase family DNA binding protein